MTFFDLDFGFVRTLFGEVSFNSNAVWSIVSDAVVKGDLEYWF